MSPPTAAGSSPEAAGWLVDEVLSFPGSDLVAYAFSCNTNARHILTPLRGGQGQERPFPPSLHQAVLLWQGLLEGRRSGPCCPGDVSLQPPDHRQVLRLRMRTAASPQRRVRARPSASSVCIRTGGRCSPKSPKQARLLSPCRGGDQALLGEKGPGCSCSSK